MSKISICNDKSLEIPRQPDGAAFILHCTGGFQAAKIDNDIWQIAPVFDEGKPCVKGFMSKAHLQAFIAQNGFLPIAFQNIGWHNGAYHSSWTPVIPDRTNHFRGPADLWRSISSNLTRARSDKALRSMSEPSHEEIAALLDSRSEAERLAQSITLSLRNMDITIEKITEFYHGQLINLMATGRLAGEAVKTTLDQTLYAHVQAFLMHLGCARDYLGALIAFRIGESPEKIDSMARLIGALRPHHFAGDKLLELLRAKNFIQQPSKKVAKWKVSGWLKVATDLRNEFVHRRHYGDRFSEKLGRIRAVDAKIGLYRYSRPIVIDEDSGSDLLDVITDHYRQAMDLFHSAASVAGYDMTIPTIPEEDIISQDADGGS